MIERILLGTAQLSGFRYANLQAPLSRADSERILDAAWEMGIRGFDTAESYGAAVDRLETWLKATPHPEAFVTTKVTPGGGIFHRAFGAMGRFWAWLDTLYLHGLPRDALEWDKFQTTTQKVGSSIYIPSDHAAVIQWGDPRRWQLPLSTFQYFKPEEPCDVRSVFQAGVAVSDPVAQLREALAMLRPADRLVIGVDHPRQLEAIARACEPSR